jgi:transposase-like protein
MAGTGETGGMKQPPNPHYRHRFPAEIISHAVWLYHVFSLSLRDVELVLAERGIIVSYETVRRWCRKFAQSFADRLRRRRPRPGDKWHLDEVFIRIQGVSIIYGVPWIRTALSSTSSFRNGAMRRLPNGSSSIC